MPLLAIDGLSASYGALPILRDIDLTVEKGSVVALIGPSGSGKSTLLRTLVGLTRATAGVVRFADETIRYDSPASLKAARRRMAIVFQQYNLFQNMTALGNVTVAPLQVQHRPRGEVDREAGGFWPRWVLRTSTPPIRTSSPAASSSGSPSPAPSC